MEISINAGAVVSFVRVVVAVLAGTLRGWVGYVFWDRTCRLLDDIVSLTVAPMVTLRVLCIGSRL